MSDNGATMTQDRSESSAKYKVGDEVLYSESKYFVISATRTQAGLYLYNIERRVTLAAIGVTENMLDPAEEAAQ